MTTLRIARTGQVWLFMDDNQRVYEAQLDVPDEFRPFDLTVNCRNTQAIAREVLKKYKGEIEPEISGPVGPRDRAARSSTIRSRPFSAKVERPDREGGGAAAGHRRPLLAQPRELGGRRRRGCPGEYFYVDKPEPVGPYVRFSSIRGFKGLESPVVILCELEDLDDETRDQQLYVGMSRAKNHCVVVVPTSRP